MAWTEGYVADIDYVAEFYAEMGPDLLNFICVANGVEPVPLHRDFTYCELGFGRGVSLTVLAATNPRGRFYGVDFNPGQVAEAARIAASANLENLTLIERSFSELFDADAPTFPEFDFITLHGVYTWISAENRRLIRRFIRRYLKPGGIAYVSYNAMPGWLPLLPMQRFMREAASFEHGRGERRLDAARHFVDRLSKLGANDFSGGALLELRMKSLVTADPRYLAHEYLNECFEPLYHADVARELLADSKLQFVASAELPRSFLSLYLTEPQQKLLAEISDDALRETAKDCFVRTPFRRDVFVRGAYPTPLPRQIELLHGYGLALCLPRTAAKLKMQFSFGEIGAREDVYNPLLDALSKRPRGFAELADLAPFRGKPLSALLEAACVLIASRQVAVYALGDSDDANETARSTNRIFADRLALGGDVRVLASPRLRSGISVPLVGLLVSRCMTGTDATTDPTIIAQRIDPILTSLGHRLEIDGKAIEDDEEYRTTLANIVGNVLDAQGVVWRQLGIV